MPTESQLAREHLGTALRYERLPQNSPRRVGPQLVGLAVAYSYSVGYSRADILEMVRLSLDGEQLLEESKGLNGSGSSEP